VTALHCCELISSCFTTGNETAMGAAISIEDCGRKVTNTAKFSASYNRNKSKRRLLP
jgi:hypothetical protein